MFKKWLKPIAIMLICATLAACIGSGARFNAGIKSFKQQNYRDAFIRLLPVAKQGNPDAQYAVGYMYYYGEGVVADKPKAIKWISLAAIQGQPDAKKALEVMKKSQPSRYQESFNPSKRPW